MSRPPSMATPNVKHPLWKRKSYLRWTQVVARVIKPGKYGVSKVEQPKTEAEVVAEVVKRKQIKNISDLPRDIAEAIFQQTASTPSWIWFKFEQTDGTALIPTRSRTPVSLERPSSEDSDGDGDGEHSRAESLHGIPVPRWGLQLRAVVITSKTAEYTNEEINASKMFRNSESLREGLTASGAQQHLYKVAQETVEALSKPRSALGPPAQALMAAAEMAQMEADLENFDKPWEIEIGNRIVTPKVRRQVDWFFLDGYIMAWKHAEYNVEKMPRCRSIREVRVCVLRLEDFYQGWILGPGRESEQRARRRQLLREIGIVDMLDKTKNRHYTINMAALLGRLTDKYSVLEECRILVGDVPDNVKPSDLEELEVKSGLHDELIIDVDPPISEKDMRMMWEVKQLMDNFVLKHREWCYTYLATPVLGEEVKTFQTHSMEFSKWLSTQTGRLWLRDTKGGQDWLQTIHGHEWLAWTSYGMFFLNTDQGIEWLNSEAAITFLESDYAHQWAQYGQRSPLNDPNGPIEVAYRVWYDTPRGHEWFNAHYPDRKPRDVDIYSPSWTDSPPHPQTMIAPWKPNKELPFNMFVHVPLTWCFMRMRGGYDPKGKGKA
ncbi:hypothetical protein F5Y19DRAFT_487789 [Xylariaceae sp. FL1651]|nr:hypothetical protein F5Y19DRAFT_487789 [Xylariaceae sp. FL1651]